MPPLTGATAVGAVGTLGLLVAIVMAIRRSSRERVASWFDAPGRLWLLPVILLGYCLGFMGLGGVREAWRFAAMAAYFMLPAALLVLRGRYAGKAGLVDAAVVLLLWLPIELRGVQKSVEIGDVGYPIGVFCAALYGLLLFTSWRRLDLNCDWSLRREDLKRVGWVFLLLVILILPTALLIGFVRFGVHPRAVEHPWAFPLLLVGMFFAPAFVEEFMFRGLIQNLLLTRLRWVPALAASSVIFGLAHVNNKAGAYGVPNWPYVGFATVAGAGYGYVYHRSRSLVASSLLHALVDFTWVLLFKAG